MEFLISGIKENIADNKWYVYFHDKKDYITQLISKTKQESDTDYHELKNNQN